eukprot:TRINITY_DN5458_c0_g1_i4.p1 TRINITY_DN5458_c0_g1~~TRINITY_DN5458_c0_g1_i4.p1  ORF type:complete len:116 (-),score=28.05 TRINITY_DN5458_c0_g1_i4:128-475(-)
MIRRPPRSTQGVSSAASDVYKRQTFKKAVDELAETVVARLREFAHPFDATMLEKLYKEFNKSKSGGITIDEVSNMLCRLGFSVERKYLTGLFKKFDMNNSGVIEYDEFVKFLTSK